MAIIQDAFTDTTNTSLDAHSGGGFSWTEYLGTLQDFKISSNQLQGLPGTTAGQKSMARAESDLSGSDMYGKITIGAMTLSSYKSNQVGPALRFDSGANTAYWACLGANGGSPVTKGFRVGKVVAGTYTILATVTYNFTTGDVFKLDRKSVV